MSVGGIGASSGGIDALGTSAGTGAGTGAATTAEGGDGAAAVSRGSAPRDPLAGVGGASAATAASATSPSAAGTPLGDALRAYDHLVARFAGAAGGNDRLSRAEANAVLAELRAEGRGAAALAAEGALDAIAAFQRAQHGRAGDLDLARGRAVIELWLGQGAGLASPTGLALGELAASLDLPPPRGRTPHAVPERGLDHVAALLAAAGGADGRATRAEVRAAVAGLEAEGRGTEALALTLLYEVVDRRDARAGADTAAAPLAAAVAAAARDLLRVHDANRNGYAAAEIASFPPVARALLEVGRLLEGGALPRPTPGVSPGGGPGPTPAPGPIAIPFDENEPLPPGFAPDRVIRDGSFRVTADGTVELQGIAGSDPAETKLLEAAFAAIWERSTQHRAWPSGALAEVARNGEMRLGTWDHPSGETVQVAYWKDVDDDSHVFYFRRAPGAEPAWDLAHIVFMN